MQHQETEQRPSMAQGRHAGASGCMERSSCRFYLCLRCRAQTYVCRRCDRGQVYCGRDCALEARRQRQRKARARYQATDRGRTLHAERSRRYRERKRRVTDQGPVMTTADPSASRPIAISASSPQQPAVITTSYRTACHFCENAVTTFVRQTFLRQTRRRSVITRYRRSTRRR
jgi:hypothetical protein